MHGASPSMGGKVGFSPVRHTRDHRPALLLGRGWFRQLPFIPATFQAPDGALTLNPGGNYVEPYFATKALIVAQDGGLDVREAAEAWIGWALPRQRPEWLIPPLLSRQSRQQ